MTGAAWSPTTDAEFDHEIRDRRRALRPAVTWGTNPAQSVSIDDVVPDPDSFDTDGAAAVGAARADLHGPAAGHARSGTSPSTPCSSARAPTAGWPTCGPPPRSSGAGRSAPAVRALVVPGSARVKAEAEAEGLDRQFTEAGFEWRSAGCSMCLGMNGDILSPGERSASTSNRNFEGRQGPGGRTHLVSPAVAAATAVAGHFAAARRRVMAGMQQVTGRAVALDRRDVDTDQIIPAAWLKRVERTGFAAGLFGAWRAEPGLRPEPARRRPGEDPGGRRQLRLRLVPRARRLGAAGLRLPGRRRAELRRHLPRQLHQLRAGTGEADEEDVAQAVRARCRRPGGRGRRRRGRRAPSASRRPASAEPFALADFARWRLLEGLDDIALTLRHDDGDRRIRDGPARPGCRQLPPYTPAPRQADVRYCGTTNVACTEPCSRREQISEPRCSSNTSYSLSRSASPRRARATPPWPARQGGFLLDSDDRLPCQLDSQTQKEHPVEVTGAQALVRSLEEQGVDVVFGLPGGAILPAYDPLLSSSLRHVLVRHEQGAGHAAEGYAWATGPDGVCMATSGPGATNLVTALADAYMDSVPIVAITGQVGTAHDRHRRVPGSRHHRHHAADHQAQRAGDRRRSGSRRRSPRRSTSPRPDGRARCSSTCPRTSCRPRRPGSWPPVAGPARLPGARPAEPGADRGRGRAAAPGPPPGALRRRRRDQVGLARASCASSPSWRRRRSPPR